MVDKISRHIVAWNLQHIQTYIMNQQRPTSNSLFEAVIVFGPGWTELEDVETESKISKKVMIILLMKHLDTYIFKDCLLGRFICIFDCGIATLIFLKDRMDRVTMTWEVYSWIKITGFQRFKDTGISMDFQGFLFWKEAV